jgi:hypothetical protein
MCWLSRLEEIVGIAGTEPPAAKRNRELFAVSGKATRQDSSTPNPLTQQGAR